MMMRSRTVIDRSRTFFLAAICTQLFFLLTPARAQADDRKAEAESLFAEARALGQQGRWDAACPKFAESYRLEPGLGTLLNLASCNEQLGKVATAWAWYREALALAQRAGDTKRVAFARKHIDVLEKKLSHLTIVVAPESSSTIEGLTITRDGGAVSSASWGSAIAVDPGEHVVEARAPGRRTFSTSVKVSALAAEEVTVQIPALALDSSSPSPPPSSPPRPTGPTKPETPGTAPSPPPPTSSSMKPIVGWGGIAVGGVGVLVSGIFGGLAISKNSEASDHCPTETTCDREGIPLSENAQDLAGISTVAGVVGVVLVAAGVSALLFWPRSSSSSASASSSSARARASLLTF